MATTAVYLFPYQVLSDPPDGPNLGKNLADRVEAVLQGNLTLGGNLTVPGSLTAATMVASSALTVNGVSVGLPVSRVKTQRTTTQSVASATFTTVLWTSADEYDTDALHDTATNSDRITFNKVGLWQVSYSITCVGSTAGARAAYLTKNGAGARLAGFEVPPASTGASSLSGSIPVPCTVAGTDYVTLTVWQNSGGALNYAGSVDNNYLSAYYLGT